MKRAIIEILKDEVKCYFKNNDEEMELEATYYVLKDDQDREMIHVSILQQIKTYIDLGYETNIIYKK